MLQKKMIRRPPTRLDLKADAIEELEAALKTRDHNEEEKSSDIKSRIDQFIGTPQQRIRERIGFEPTDSTIELR